MLQWNHMFEWALFFMDFLGFLLFFSLLLFALLLVFRHENCCKWFVWRFLWSPCIVILSSIHGTTDLGDIVVYMFCINLNN